MKRFGFLALVTVAGILACDRATIGGGASEDYASVSFKFALPGSVLLTGLPDAAIKRLRDAKMDSEGWQRLFRVSVDGSDSIAIAGRYTLGDNNVEFRPMFSFDPGRKYTATFDLTVPPLNQPRGGRSSSFAVANNAAPTEPTSVVRILPSGDEWLENQLRFYVEFSSPMSRSSGLSHVKLFDAKGREVTQALLPLEADYWNHDATRYTFFFDPGRVKRGILPNEQMGPPLVSGGQYTLVVDSLWKDTHGKLLSGSFRRTFRVIPPSHEKIAIVAWTVVAPKRDTREPLIVRLPRQLDHGLLLRALGVETARNVAISGEGSVEKGEREWHFTPQFDWQAREYQIVVFSILEDGAGNRIDRPFEVDKFEQVDSVATPERYTIKFVVK